MQLCLLHFEAYIGAVAFAWKWMGPELSFVSGAPATHMKRKPAFDPKTNEP